MMPETEMASLTPTGGEVRRAVGWSALHVWGAQSVNLVIFVILARLLAPSVFGVIALAAVFVSLAKSLVDQGMSTAIIQRRDLTDVHLDSVFWISVGIGAAFTATALILADPMAALFTEPALAPVIRWLSILFAIDALGTVQQALLRRRFAFRSLAIRGLVSVVAGGAVGVVMAAYDRGVSSLVAQQIVTAAVGVILLWRLERWRPRLRFTYAGSRDLLSFGYSILGIRLLTFASRRSDDVLVGYVLGATALGYYTIAYKIYKVLLDLLASVVARVAMPALATLQEDSDKFRNSVGIAVQAVALIAFPTFVGLAALAPDIVAVVFGESWAPSAPVMRVLAVAGVTQGLSLIFQQAFIAHGKPSWAFRLMLASTVVLIFGFVVAAPSGIVWVAAAFGLVGAALLPIQVLALDRMVGFGFGQLAYHCRGPLTGTALMIGGLVLSQVSAAQLSPAPRMAVGIAIGAVCYTAGVALADRTLLNRGLALVQSSSRSRSSAQSI